MKVTVLDEQRKLKALGYPPGPMDGHDGPGLREAIGKFQVDRNMLATGNPTDILMLGELFGLPITGVDPITSDLPASYWDADPPAV